MSLELVNTFATLGTFVAIAATAVAAIVQLRHARSSNQIVALNEFNERAESPDFQATDHFLVTKLLATMGDTSIETIDKVPGLADIPLIGGLFKNKQTGHEGDEIVFLITPHVIYPGSQASQDS